MAFEIVPSPHLPPHRCAACGCTEEGPYAFLPFNAAWENGWVFLCKKCIGEMADQLGITLKTIEKEVIKEVEVVRDPTPEEMLAFVLTYRDGLPPKTGADTTPPPLPPGVVNLGTLTVDELANRLAGKPGQGAPSAEEKAVCICGKEFTGPSATANLGRHKAHCAKAKEAGAHG